MFDTFNRCQWSGIIDPLLALENNPLIMLILFSLGLADKACLDLFSEQIRVALDVDRRRVMENPIKDRRGDYWVPEDLVPLVEAAV